MYSNVPTIAPASSRVSRDRSVESVTRDVDDGSPGVIVRDVDQERDAPGSPSGTPDRDFLDHDVGGFQVTMDDVF